MQVNESPLLLKALRGETIPRFPVWLMRQAGRYMAEYRALKAKHGFLELCRNAELVAEVTLQPMRFLDVDAAIIFSDILTPTEGMGFKLDFSPGPIIHNPIRSAADVASLKVPDTYSATPFVHSALRQLKPLLAADNKALIGFAGSPWTLACYLIDQGPFKHFAGTQVFAARHPVAFGSLLEKLSTLVTEYVVAQHESGADVIQIFDSWGGVLSADDFCRFSLPYLKKIISALRQRNCPIVLFVGNGAHVLPHLAESGASCISLDWRIDLSTAENLCGTRCAIQGNLDPTALFLDSSAIKERTLAMLSGLKRRSLYIANLGHGILAETPPENVKTFVDTVKAFRLNG